jgi:hypothetical protein
VKSKLYIFLFAFLLIHKSLRDVHLIFSAVQSKIMPNLSFVLAIWDNLAHWRYMTMPEHVNYHNREECYGHLVDID